MRYKTSINYDFTQQKRQLSLQMVTISTLFT